MLELSPKAQLVLNKVSMELSSGMFSLSDKLQLSVFCYEKPSMTYLGLLEKVEKYLPTNMDLTEEQINELEKIYLAYKKLVNRELSPVMIKLHQDTCIKIRLKEIVYEPCWYLPFFTKFIKDMNNWQYLEFQNWEEVLLVPALLGQSKIDITKVEIKLIKEFYLKNKLKVKAISKTYRDNLVNAAISNRQMQWELMTPEELQKEKIEIENSNMFGRLIYLARLKDEFKI